MKRLPAILLFAVLLTFPGAAAEESALDPALAGCWKTPVMKDQDLLLLRFEPKRLTLNEDGELSAARVRYHPGRVEFKDWSVWRTFKVELRDGKLQLTEDGKTRTLEKLDTLPPELDLTPTKLGELKVLDPVRIEAIRKELAARVKTDQKIRTDASTTPEQWQKINDENIAWIRKLVLEIGWIDVARFGAETSDDAFLLIQHSMDVKLMQAVLPELEHDVRALLAKKQLYNLGDAYALLYDRTTLHLGGDQRYGSQLGEDAAGNLVIPSLEAPEYVNERRALIGMVESLARYAAGFRSQKGGRPRIQADDESTPADAAMRMKLIDVPRTGESLFPKDTRFQADIDAGALRKVTLPEKASKDDVEAFVRKILDYSKDQTTFNSSDPQMQMLESVGAENVDVLVKLSTPQTWYVNQVIDQLAQPEHKELILKAAARNSDLITTVVSHNWQAELKQTLLDSLHNAPKPLPTGWMDAAASLNDPASYEDLKRQAILSGSSWVFEAIAKRIPGLDLTDTVHSAWKQHRGESWKAMNMAVVAARYGEKDALEMLITNGKEEYLGEQFCREFSALTGAKGEFAELQKWFAEHKDALVFDTKERVYRVK